MPDELPTDGPLTQIVTAIRDAIADNLPRDLTWPILLLTLIIAIGIWFLRSGHGSKDADGRERHAGLVEFLLPRRIYTHVSARVDIWLYVVDRVMRLLWAPTILVTVAPWTEQTMLSTLAAAFGSGPALASNYAWMLLYSLFILLCYDFIFFLIHYS